MAIVSLVALLGALALAVLISFQPWAATSVAPQLSIAPGLGVALGDAIEVAPGRQLAVAPAQPANGIGPRFAVNGVEAASERGSSRQLDVAPAQVVVAVHRVGPPSVQAEPPAPEASPLPQSPPASEAVPVAAPVQPASPQQTAVPPERPAFGGGSTSGPIGSGGGTGGGVISGPVQVHEGDEFAYSFSFYVEPTVYREPQSENLIVRFLDQASESHNFGLQLWDDGSGTQRGLWSSGDAMGGERFLTPVTEGAWYEVVVCFKASSEADGFYLLLLDGEPIDARAWVSLIEPGSGDVSIETGLFRDGQPVVGAPDISFGPVRLGETVESVIP